MQHHWPPRVRPWVPLAGAFAILFVATATLHAMGRPLICPCGYVKFFHTGIDDREVSQHFIDAYTYSHLTHGILLYAVMSLIAWAGQARPSLAWGLMIAAAFAGLWEVLENTPIIVRSYAITTIVPDYAGDSIVNSIGDMLATAAGFLIAAYLPVAITLLLLAIGMFLPHDNPWIALN
jgi:hypothetical protein